MIELTKPKLRTKDSTLKTVSRPSEFPAESRCLKGSELVEGESRCAMPKLSRKARADDAMMVTPINSGKEEEPSMKPNKSVVKNKLVRPSLKTRLRNSAISQNAASNFDFEIDADPPGHLTNTCQRRSQAKMPKNTRSSSTKNKGAQIQTTRIYATTKVSGGEPPKAQRRAAAKASKQLDSSKLLIESDDPQDDDEFHPSLAKKSRKKSAAKTEESKSNGTMQLARTQSSVSINVKQSSVLDRGTSRQPIINDKLGSVSPEIARASTPKATEMQYQQNDDNLPEATTHFEDALDQPGDHLIIDGGSESAHLSQAQYPLVGEPTEARMTNGVATEENRTVHRPISIHKSSERAPRISAKPHSLSVSLVAPSDSEDSVNVAGLETQAQPPPKRAILSGTQAHLNEVSASIEHRRAVPKPTETQASPDAQPSAQNFLGKASCRRMKPSQTFAKMFQYPGSDANVGHENIRQSLGQQSKQDVHEGSRLQPGRMTYQGFETPVNSHASRKPTLISFSLSGPKNQGTVSSSKPEEAMRKAKAMDVTDTLKIEGRKRNPPIRLDMPHKRQKVAPPQRNIISEIHNTEDLDAIAQERLTPTSQGSRVQANGSPMPASQPNIVHGAYAEETGEDDDIEEQPVTMDYADGETEACTELPTVKNLSIDEKHALIRSSSSKQIPSSPMAPSNMLTNSEAHCLHSNGVLTNVVNDHIVQSQDLHDPFLVPGELKESSFTRLLRKSSQAKLVEQQKDLAVDVTSRHLGGQNRAIDNEDLEKTLVNDEDDENNDDAMQDQSSEAREISLGSDANESEIGHHPKRQDGQSSEDWVLGISKHQTNVLEALFGISHVMIISSRGGI